VGGLPRLTGKQDYFPIKRDFVFNESSRDKPYYIQKCCVPLKTKVYHNTLYLLMINKNPANVLENMKEKMVEKW
jgi:hypothetical protein